MTLGEAFREANKTRKLARIFHPDHDIVFDTFYDGTVSVRQEDDVAYEPTCLQMVDDKWRIEWR